MGTSKSGKMAQCVKLFATKQKDPGLNHKNPPINQGPCVMSIVKDFC